VRRILSTRVGSPHGCYVEITARWNSEKEDVSNQFGRSATGPSTYYSGRARSSFALDKHSASIVSPTADGIVRKDDKDSGIMERAFQGLFQVRRSRNNASAVLLTRMEFPHVPTGHVESSHQVPG
jgi:hypothetical protein